MRKIGKRGEQKTLFSKIVAIILLALVLIFIFFFLVSSDMRGVLDELLPDFVPWKGNPPDLTVQAVVYGNDVTLLLNDGNSRCIVESVFQPGESNKYLLNYGIKDNFLNMRSDSKSNDWEKVSTGGIQRITNYMREKVEIVEKEDKIMEEIKKIYDRGTDSGAIISVPIGNTESNAGMDFDAQLRNYIVENNNLNLAILDLSYVPEEVKEDFLEKLKSFDVSPYDVELVYKNYNEEYLYFFQYTKDESLYVRGGKRYVSEGNSLTELNEENYPLLKFSEEILKNQIIKQDLFVGCYRDEDDFKEAGVLGKKVTVLTEDENGRCLIYDSPEDRSLEHYALRGYLTSAGRLFWLDSSGKVWTSIPSLTKEEKEDIEAISSLEELGELSVKLNLYFRGFNVDLCQMQDRTQCYSPTEEVKKINDYLKEIGKSSSDTWEILAKIKNLADEQDGKSDGQRIYFTNKQENVEKESFNNIIRAFAKSEGSEDSLFCNSNGCYFEKIIGDRRYYYNDGKFRDFESPYLGKSDEEIFALINRDLILKDLKEVC